MELNFYSRNFSLFSTELQRASGLRVLRRVRDRKRAMEEDEVNEKKELTVKNNTKRGIKAAATVTKEEQMEMLKRKPPAKLKPLWNIFYSEV